MEAETVKTKAKPKKEHVDHPAPEVMAREATPDEIPKTAATLARIATESGWEVSVTYARGTTYSDHPKLVHSIAVRMRREGQRAAAAWMAPVELKAVKRKEKVPTGETEIVTVTRKRKGVSVEIEVEKPIMKEVEVEHLEQVWTFDCGLRLGKWTCQKTGKSGTFPIKLGSSELKAYLSTPTPVRTGELPVDVWLPSQEAADTQELFAQLARMFAGDDMEDVT